MRRDGIKNGWESWIYSLKGVHNGSRSIWSTALITLVCAGVLNMSGMLNAGESSADDTVQDDVTAEQESASEHDGARWLDEETTTYDWTVETDHGAASFKITLPHEFVAEFDEEIEDHLDLWQRYSTELFDAMESLAHRLDQGSDVAEEDAEDLLEGYDGFEDGVQEGEDSVEWDDHLAEKLGGVQLKLEKLEEWLGPLQEKLAEYWYDRQPKYDERYGDFLDTQERVTDPYCFIWPVSQRKDQRRGRWHEQEHGHYDDAQKPDVLEEKADVEEGSAGSKQQDEVHIELAEGGDVDALLVERRDSYLPRNPHALRPHRQRVLGVIVREFLHAAFKDPRVRQVYLSRGGKNHVLCAY